MKKKEIKNETKRPDDNTVPLQIFKVEPKEPLANKIISRPKYNLEFTRDELRFLKEILKPIAFPGDYHGEDCPEEFEFTDEEREKMSLKILTKLGKS